MGTKFVFIVLIALTSCTKKGLDCYEEATIGTFANNKMILIGSTPEENVTYFEIVAGNCRVFTLNHSGFQCDKVYDDEWGEQVVFQVDGNLNSFSIQENEFEKALCFYGQYGAWTNHRQDLISFGSIEGERIDEEEWSVCLRVVLPEPNNMGEGTLEFQGVFTRKD